MHKGLVFVGPSESGKTRKAREIAGLYDPKNVTWIAGRNTKGLLNSQMLNKCRPETELIVVDDLKVGFGLSFFYDWVTDELVINPSHWPCFSIKPKLLITGDYLTTMENLRLQDSDRRRFDFVDFSDQEAIARIDVKNPFSLL